MDNLTTISDRTRWTLLLAQHRARLLSAYAGLTEVQISTLADDAGWALRDVLGHVADWSFTIADAVDGALAGKALTEVEFNKLQEWNDAHTALRHSDSWQKVKGDYDEAWRRVSAALDRVSEAQFGLPAARNERGPIALYPWLFIVPHHEEEHAGYLKEWVMQEH
jgi:DinB superfamily